MRRRRFMRLAGAGAACSLLFPRWAEALEPGRNEVRLVILHTNDTHSRIDPFPLDGGPFEGLGGIARRGSLVEGVRAEHRHVLLLDSGDMFQGTPYFNFFRGEVEFKAMSAMGYRVATLGNHDFDNGVGGLVEVMPHATFDFVSANYDVSGSPLQPHVRPWVIQEREGLKVGIFGLGIAFEGLVLASLHQGVRYTDPYAAARRAVAELRARGCAFVICLSHLGYRYRGDTPSDTTLAQEVGGIDLILGGHTHTFMDEPDVYTQADGSQTVVNQVGWGGMRLGRIDVLLGPGGRAHPGAGPALGPKAWAWSTYAVDAHLD